MKPRSKRFLLAAGGLAVLAVAAALVLNAFRSNLVFFFTPTQLVAGEAPKERALRIGGLVQAGSVKRDIDGLTVKFVVTDTAKSIPVTYKGILPDLFREGKGVVVEGRLDPRGIFKAAQVLAKHDENYMPPEAAEAMQQARIARERAAGSVSVRERAP